MNRAFSRILRIAAATGALAALVSHHAPAGSAAPLFQGAPVVSVPNMVAYWAVDTDTGTTATDSSGNGNTGTYSGGNGGATKTAASPGIPTGNTSSFLFDQPNNQFINVPDSASISMTGAFTLAAWARRTADNASLQKGIIEKYDGGGNGYSLRIGQSEHYGFSVYSGATQKGITTAGTAVPFRGSDLNTWNHVAGVYDPAGSPQMLIYKNGNPDATNSSNAGQEPVAAPTDGSAALQIGKDYGANAFNGNIDEVRIYNRALNAAEVGVLMTGQPAATGLVAAGAAGQVNLTWTAPVGTLASTQYSVLRGPSAGTYDTVFNNISGTTYADTTVTPGTPYFYTVVAVTVMSSPNSNESSATASPGVPPPPPPPPRTGKLGSRHMCGWSTILPGDGLIGAAAAGVAALLLLALTRRRPLG